MEEEWGVEGVVAPVSQSGELSPMACRHGFGLIGYPGQQNFMNNCCQAV